MCVLLFNSPEIPEDAAGVALAEALRHYWVQFAATGNPNARGLPNWPAYNPASGLYLELGTRIKAASLLHEDAFQLVNRLYGTRLTGIKPR
jgi:para-nitrobenzyl esterase